MSIRVTCDCGKVLIAKDDYAGKKAKCPDCGNVLIVPKPEVLDAEATDQDDIDFTSSDEETSESDDRRTCPACGEDIKKTAVKCRYCGEILDPSFKGKSRSGRGSSRRGGAGSTADLGKRFLGSAADGLIGFVFVGPGYILLIAGGADQQQGNDLPPMAMLGLGLLVLGGLALLGIQLYLLATRSQSIGKCLVKTKIYDYETNEPAGFVKCFLLRAVVNGLIGGIPCIGPIYSLVDIFFIFGDDHRCLHDKLAGTYVVDVS